MDEKNTIQLFEDQAIRTAWDEEQQAPIGRFGKNASKTKVQMNCLQIVSS